MSLNPSDLDLIRNAAFIAAFLFSPGSKLFNLQAGIVLAFSVVGKIAFNLSDTGFYACLSMAALFSINAGLNIGIKSEIRHALIAIGCVNWLGAVDFMLWPDRVTYVYMAYPYLINLLDLFIIYHLFYPGYGGGKVAKIYNNRLDWHCWIGLSGRF